MSTEVKVIMPTKDVVRHGKKILRKATPYSVVATLENHYKVKHNSGVVVMVSKKDAEIYDPNKF